MKLDNTLALLENFQPGEYSEKEEEVFDEEEVRTLAYTLKRFLYAPSVLRAALQRHGVTITPSNYYSEIPTIDEIEESFAKGVPQYATELFDAARFRNHLRTLAEYAEEFNPPLDPNEEEGVYGWNNGMFSYSDAMSYYSTIRHVKPNTILEVGSGYSTLIAKQAMKNNGKGNIKCIEPYPREFLKQDSDLELLSDKVQNFEANFFNDNLEDGDILFIDSTHTVKHAADCLHIYLNVLPKIRHKLWVHVHDIYLPSALPISMLRDRQIYWTEQYLLCAYLLDNPKTELVYGSNYNNAENPAELDDLMSGRYPKGGASLWFKLNW